MKVREIMTRDLTAEEKTIPVRELIFILSSALMSNMPIVDEEGKLIGVISEKDLIKAALPGYFEMLHSTSFIPDMNQLAKKLVQIADDSIEKYMERDFICVEEDDDDLQWEFKFSVGIKTPFAEEPIGVGGLRTLMERDTEEYTFSEI